MHSMQALTEQQKANLKPEPRNQSKTKHEEHSVHRLLRRGHERGNRISSPYPCPSSLTLSLRLLRRRVARKPCNRLLLLDFVVPGGNQYIMGIIEAG